MCGATSGDAHLVSRIGCSVNGIHHGSDEIVRDDGAHGLAWVAHGAALATRGGLAWVAVDAWCRVVRVALAARHGRRPMPAALEPGRKIAPPFVPGNRHGGVVPSLTRTPKKK